MLHVMKDDFDENADDILKSINEMLRNKEKSKDNDEENNKEKKE